MSIKYTLQNKDTGRSFQDKLAKLSNILKSRKIDCQFISSSENIAWLLNMRGADSEFTPLPHSYFFIDKDKNYFLFYI